MTIKSMASKICRSQGSLGLFEYELASFMYKNLDYDHGLDRETNGVLNLIPLAFDDDQRRALMIGLKAL